MKKILLICILVMLGAACSIEGIQDPIKGIDGIDGIDGKDGISSTIEVITEDDGYWLVFLENNTEIKRIFVRHGADGADGTDGKDGYNTRMNFLDITTEMESVCEEGIRVEYGLDSNRNGELDADEVETFIDICKCICNECEYDIPYYDIELICCDNYQRKATTVCEISGIKVTKGIIGKPELETTEIICF